MACRRLLRALLLATLAFVTAWGSSAGLVATVALVVSCGPSGPDGDAGAEQPGVEETLDTIKHSVENALADGKTDSPDHPAILGDIAPDQPAQGDYRQDKRYLGWVFTAASAALATQLRAESSAQSPQTALAVLLLWRPSCDSPWRTVAISDNSLSQPLPVDGDYLVVVGPRRARSRGRVRTTLSVDLSVAIFPGSCPGTTPAPPLPPPLPQAPTAAVGTIPGSFDVTGSGSAHYSMGIEVPPGRAGVEPHLSIGYDSSAGNGPLGVGFGLGGLSRIHRCNKDLTRDRARAVFRYANDDALCLDGERLIPTASGSEYRTEHESFSRIRGFDGGFQVWTREGQILYYGVAPANLPSADSRVEAHVNASGQREVRAWAIKHVEDRRGNTMSIDYLNLRGHSGETAEHLPQYIRYTGHRPSRLAPTRTIELVYSSDRPDPHSGYSFGSEVAHTRRLKEIVVSSGTGASSEPGASGIYWRYQLDYEPQPSPTTGQSRLKSITHFATDGVAKPPTLFKWHDSQLDSRLPFETQDTRIRPNRLGWPEDMVAASGKRLLPLLVPPSPTMIPIDADGDGRTDLLYPQDGHWWLIRALPTGGYGSAIDTGLAALGVVPFDFNGDGRTDLLLHDLSRTWQIAVSTGDHFRIVDTEVPRPWRFWDRTGNELPKWVSSVGYVRVVDLDGDMQPELLVCEPPANGSVGRFRHIWPGRRTLPADIDCLQDAFVLADVDGDGVLDPLVARGDGPNVTFRIAGGPDAGTDTHIPRIELDGEWLRDPVTGRMADKVPAWAQSIDLNGDGLDDFVSFMPTRPDGLHVWLNHGGAVGFVKTPDNILSFASLGQLQQASVADFDGDGRADLFIPGVGLHTWTGTTLVQRSTTVPTLEEAAVVDVNGDGLLDLSDGHGGVVVRQGHWPDLLVEIRDGRTSQVPGYPPTLAVRYRPFSDGAVYRPEIAACADPNPIPSLRARVTTCVKSGHWLVSEVKGDAGGGLPASSSQYTYGDARVHNLGLGWLGFSRREIADPDTRTTTTLLFDNTKAELAGLPAQEDRVTWLDRGSHRTTTTHAYDTLGGRAIPPFGTLGGHTLPVFTQVSDLQDEVTPPYRWVRTTAPLATSVDANGCATQTTTEWSDGTRESVGTDYWPVDDWLPCRPKGQTHTSTQGGETQTRSSTTDYYEGTRLPWHVTREPNGGASLRLRTTLGRDPYGNLTSTTLDATDPITNRPERRSSTVQLDLQGMFPVQVTNAAGHVHRFRHDPVRGNLLVHQDPNFVSTRYAYDGFGRLGREVRMDETETTTRYSAILERDLPGFQVETDEHGLSPNVAARFDSLGRQVRTTAVTLSGMPAIADTVYDARGFLESQTRPYFGNLPTSRTTTAHDNLGRLTSVRSPGGMEGTTQLPDRVASQTYDGLTVRVTDPSGHVQRIDHTPRGEVAASVGAEGVSGVESTSRHYYGPFGAYRHIDVLRSGGEAVSTFVETDAYGRRIGLRDPDSGHHTTTWNAFGEIVREVADDARRTVTFERDPLGRTTKRSDPDGTTTWKWDTAANGIGALASMESPRHLSGRVHRESIRYERMGRPFAVTTTLETAPGVSERFTVGQSYDRGRPDLLIYPAAAGRIFALKHHYNDFGYLDQLLELGLKPLWTAKTGDAEGRVRIEELGNQVLTTTGYDEQTGQLSFLKTTSRAGSALQALTYAYHPTGLLKERVDTRSTSPQREDFLYDELGRLAHTQVTGKHAGSVDIAYDPLGNITSKSDVGTYAYASPRPDRGIRPHAVTTAGLLTFAYDSLGNQIRRTDPPRGLDLKLEYTAFDKPSRVFNGDRAQPDAIFEYDADSARVLHESGGIRKLSVDNLYEKQTAGTGAPAGTPAELHRYYVRLGDRVVAQLEREPGLTTDRVLFFHPDHLGSSNVLSDREGNPAQAADGSSLERSFDPWGKLRQPDWSDPGEPLSRATPIGFTGHSDELYGLVDMKGRIYDPTTARFLQADPFVQAPTNSQSHNRYSYVLNSPLNLIDPTGYWEQDPNTGFFCQGSGYNRYKCQAENPSSGSDSGAADAAKFSLRFRNGFRRSHEDTVGRKKAADKQDESRHGPPSIAKQLEDIGQFLTQPTQKTIDQTLDCAACQPFLQLAAAGVMGIASALDPRDPWNYLTFVPVAGVVRFVGTAAKGAQAYRIVKYGQQVAATLEKHHGVLDIWASKNIPGYVSRGAATPAIVLNATEHGATKAVYRDWLFRRTGKRVGGTVDWTTVSAREAQDLSDRMFRAAGVPREARQEYFREFHRYIYGL